MSNTESGVSALVMTLNEEATIDACLNSLNWCRDVVVLDSNSSDQTVSKARARGCRVYQREFDNWSSHQNWALRNIEFKYPWVLNMDADEQPDSELAQEVLAAVARPGEARAYRMRRKDYFRGVWLKHATFYPTWLTRLYRPECVEFQRLVNPVAVVEGTVGNLRGHIHHWPFSKGMSHWIERHNSYSSFEAMEYACNGAVSTKLLFSRDATVRRRALKASFTKLPCRPLLKFFYLFAVHGGVLDGKAGFDYCVLTAMYEYFISLKAAEGKEAKHHE
jgi:glycosyltransferase involved in cell wall biosynthesis